MIVAGVVMLLVSTWLLSPAVSVAVAGGLLVAAGFDLAGP